VKPGEKGESPVEAMECTTAFATIRLEDAPSVTAPDGSTVDVLLRLHGGSMARFSLAAGRTSVAVRHRTVEELWYVVAGRGELWRGHGAREEVARLEPGVCLTIPVGTSFQFRAHPGERVEAIGVTMPPWPGDDEAVVVVGPWEPR